MFKILAVTIGFFLFSYSNAEWGAKPVNSSYRTDQHWENNFPSTPTKVVDANGNGDFLTITEGINYCNSLDKREYCFIKINAGNYSTDNSSEIYIQRPNIKLSGAYRDWSSYDKNNSTRITSTAHNPKSGAGFFIYIGQNREGDVKNIVIENLHLAGKENINPISPDLYVSKAGITAYTSNIENISIRNNLIEGIKVNMQSNADRSNFINGASAISITGTGASEGTAIKNVLIENNTIRDMRNGHSENISVSGNIKHWEIKGNKLSNITNIAIDAGGGYEDSSVHSLDAARYGTIKNNKVTDLREDQDNLDGVGAIYVDGGKYIHIVGNKVGRTTAELINDGLTASHTDHSHGYTIGAEQCVTTQHITMEYNASYNAKYEDLSVGAYGGNGRLYGDENCTTGESYGDGFVKNITIKSNIFNSPNNSRLNNIYPNNSPITVKDNVSPYSIQRTFRVTSALINQDGIEEENQFGNGTPVLFDGTTPDLTASAIKKPEVTSNNNVTISSVSVASSSGLIENIIDDDGRTQWSNAIEESETSFDLYLNGTYTLYSIDFLSQWESKITVEVNGQEAFSGWTESTNGVNYTANFTTPMTGNVITIKSQGNQNWLMTQEVSNIVGTAVNTPLISRVSADSNDKLAKNIIDGNSKTQWNNAIKGSGTSFNLYLNGTYTLSSLDFLSQWDSKIIVEVNGQEAFSGWTENTNGVNYTVNFTTPMTGNVITIKSQENQDWLAVKEVSNIVGTAVNAPSISNVSADTR